MASGGFTDRSDYSFEEAVMVHVQLVVYHDSPGQVRSAPMACLAGLGGHGKTRCTISNTHRSLQNQAPQAEISGLPRRRDMGETMVARLSEIVRHLRIPNRMHQLTS